MKKRKLSQFEKDSIPAEDVTYRSTHSEIATNSNQIVQQPIDEVFSQQADHIRRTIEEYGEIVSQEKQVKVYPMENTYPGHRYLFVNDNSSSSSNDVPNMASGMCPNQTYYPLIKRITYCKKLYDEKYTEKITDIPDGCSIYKRIFTNVNGHFRYVNEHHGNAFLPNVYVINSEKVTYKSGHVKIYPIHGDLVTMDPCYKWGRNPVGDYLLELHGDKGFGLSRQEILRQLASKNKKSIGEYPSYISEYVSENISEFMFLFFFTIDLGGFGSFYFRLF